MLKKISCALIALLFLLTVSPASAALNAYLKVKGRTLGDIKGSVNLKGREGQIAVLNSNHEIVSPRDMATGLPTGKRQHKPFVITKELDKSSPILYKALITNEILTEVELRFWRGGEKGGEAQQFYTVKLTNATIASIRFVQPSSVHVDLRHLSEYEEISFTYSKIEWTWTDGGITASDDWTARI